MNKESSSTSSCTHTNINTTHTHTHTGGVSARTCEQGVFQHLRAHQPRHHLPARAQAARALRSWRACACVQPAGNRCLHPAFFIGECVCVCANIYSVCVSMCMQLLEFKCATTRPRTCRYCVGVHVHVCAIVCRVGCTKRFLINKSRALSVVHIRRQSEMAP